MKEAPEMDALPADVAALLDAERSLPVVAAPMRARIRQGVQASIAAGGGSAGTATSTGAAGAGVGALGKTLITFVLGGLVGAGIHAAWPRDAASPRLALQAPSAATPTPAPFAQAAPLQAPAPLPPPATATGDRGAHAGSAALPASSTRAARPEPDDSSTLARERQIIDAARSAIAGGHPSEGLTILARYRSEFARGTLAEERDALEIRALLALGRVDEARAAASRFYSTYPESMLSGALARQVERATGTPATP